MQDTLITKYIIDFNPETRYQIIYETGLDYIIKKYGDYLGTLTSKEVSYWNWWKRIVRSIEEEIVVPIDQAEIYITFQDYREYIEERCKRYTINKAVTYTVYKSENKKYLKEHLLSIKSN